MWPRIVTLNRHFVSLDKLRSLKRVNKCALTLIGSRNPVCSFPPPSCHLAGVLGNRQVHPSVSTGIVLVSSTSTRCRENFNQKLSAKVSPKVYSSKFIRLRRFSSGPLNDSPQSCDQKSIKSRKFDIWLQRDRIGRLKNFPHHRIESNRIRDRPPSVRNVSAKRKN